MLRREFIASLAALAATPALGSEQQPQMQLGAPEAFDVGTVKSIARSLAQSAYRAPQSVPEAWSNISYDQYNSIWFDTRSALWEGENDTPLRLDAFAPGLYFPRPIEITVVESGVAKPLLFSLDVFDKTDKFPELPIDQSLGYSGLRLRAELETKGIYTEFAVFQGASYFRAIGTGDIYGLSARGIAIDTAEPSGEEFPDFRAFWVEKPVAGSDTFVVHALLDGPSLTGAYRFEVTHGAPLKMQISATLFPRRELENVGIAPLTSMFQFDETNRDRFSDFRPAVHDSDGLLVVNGAGETLWRPLANPKTLQISAFVDDNPKGFGLMQRARKFSDFADLEALYHRRPGAWIEPGEGWGRGAVTLIEIPTDREIYDNIVVHWRPEMPLAAGSEHSVSYTLTFGADSDYGTGARVLNTRMGKAFGEGIVATIDFEKTADMPDDLSLIEKLIQSSAGEVSSGVLQRNPETGGPRLAFKFHPEDASLSDFALRFVAFAPALGIAILLSFAIFQWFAAGGVTLLERAIVALVGLTFVWISFSVSTVLMALVQRITRPCRLARTGRGPSERVALLIPVYHEDPASVFGNANAMLQELARGAQHDNYALFILSDTRDPELAEMEERAFFSLRQNCPLGMDVFYRRRLVNADKKVGNLTDWIEGWGGAYDAMLVLDADSLMSGGAIRRLTHELSADPEAGLIQSVPVLIGAQTLFGRMQQFSNAVYGWLLSEGVALWAQGEGNYWGHNAIIRTRAFAQSARLPYLRSLRGKDSLILSHDFVEAGMLRRAGWRVKFLPRLGGSYEETPQTLIDYALRDRRWCLGNLQHLRLLGARGFHPMSGFHMLQGAAAFLLSPLWFALVLIWSVLGMMPGMITQTYFVPSNPLYPIWSGADQTQGWIYMAVIYTMLLLPKLIGALALCARGDIRRDYGGAGRFIATMLFKVICAIIYAPIMMVQQTLAVFSALSGRAAAWSPQARGTDGSDLWTTLRFHKVETLLGFSLSFGIVSGTVPLSLLPVALPLLLAVALSMLGSVSIAKAKLSWMRLESPQALRVPRIVKRANEERAKMQRALETPEPIAIAAE